MSEPVSDLDTLAPIADNWRAFGIATLTDQHAALLEQSRQVPLNEYERDELRRLADALEAMQAPGPEPATASLCIVCDALPGACSHDARRYLEPITYEKGEGGRGWRVPDSERERWENPPHIASSPTIETPIPLADLADAIAQLIEVSVPLERLLGTLYERDPLAVSRLVTRTLDDAATGNVRSLGGLLYTRLRDSSKT